MTDLSWINSVITLASGGAGGSGGDGVTDYNKLNNKPVTNVSGYPVIISSLATGVYNIDGTWAVTPSDTPRATKKDDMFYVLNEDGVCKLTWISAGEIYTYSSDTNGLVEDRVTKESDSCDCEHGDNGDPDSWVGIFGEDPIDKDYDFVGTF